MENYRKIWCRYLVIFSLPLIVSTTVHAAEIANEQQSTQSQAIADAKWDAEKVINGTLWRLTGFFGNVVGVGAALVYKHPLPADALIGKTPEYVAHYTNEFHRETQGLQMYHASTGCVSFGILVLIVRIAL